MDRRRFVIAAASLPLAGTGVSANAFDQAPNLAGDDLYKPQVGQPGKDVVWVPTPDRLVLRMLEQAKVGPEDLVFDLGCGDGKIPIAAAKSFGAIAKGIEYEPDLAALARRNADRAGVADKVEIITGDIFDEKLRERYMRATVVTMYLLPHLNMKLRPEILAMRPGTRVVSHAFHMSDWEPDEFFVVDGAEAFYWVVPARAEGRWTLHSANNWEGKIELTQRFQRIGGTMQIEGKSQPLLGPYVSGEVIGFTFVDSNGHVRSARARIRGDTLEGAIRYARLVLPLKGQREPGAG